jgi:predicted lipid-binding transport protein (Tim44 family)
MRFCVIFLAAVLALGQAQAQAQAQAQRLVVAAASGLSWGNSSERTNTPGANLATLQVRPSAARFYGTAAAVPTQWPGGAWLSGLASGLGLAWLARGLGLGEESGQWLLIPLLLLAVMLLVRVVLRSRRLDRGSGKPRTWAAGASVRQASTPRLYSPDKVGNDASARPWERSGTAFETDVQGRDEQNQWARAATASTRAPTADFDAAGFLRIATINFVTLQEAWDRADLATMRSMMTERMLEDIHAQLLEREAVMQGQPNLTDVVMIDAHLLGMEDLGKDYLASVEFSGMIREQPADGPSPFREIWSMTKPKNGSSGWLVAGVQALQ